MFDEKDLEAYRSTLPRESVKTRILDDLNHGINGKKTEKIVLTRVFPLIAACLVLILSAAFLFGTAKDCVMLEPEAGIALASARSADLPLTAEAEIKIPTRVSVNSGYLVVTDAETGATLEEGTNLRVHGKVIICWQTDEETEQGGELTLSCLGVKSSYRVSGNELIRTK